ncbi:hypothetical protein Tco_0820351 [Tanacetum coccineum]|uniref:Uncharacterized protein n=1 Tax=Tanacetum coccineum TaxID=301880 RepID=A0ABQ5AC36_9ASTR
MRISTSKKPQKEPTYQVVLDAIALSPYYLTFLITADEDYMFQIDNRDSSAKRKENMPYPRFTNAIIQHFISKDKSISMRNRMFMHTVRDDSVLGTLKFVAKRAATPKKAKKWKKLAFPSKKQTLVITEEPAKKPATRRQPTGVQIKDTPGVSVSKKKTPARAKRNKCIDLLSEAALLEEAQMNKAIKWRKWETHMHQAGGSGDGAGVQPKDPDEPKGKSIDTHEATGLKPGVPDVSKADSSYSDVDLNKIDDEEETQEDEFVHTPDDYVPMDDETNDVDNEEYDGINKEMYDDVNVELKDVEFADERKGDGEMTNADKVNAELKEVNQEVASAQVQDEAQATTVAA